ncbi:hypothetical protein MNV_110025 [Candidatus Methanoperedens nitroreducens]|uniref:Uncharacterized protein n=1 Tax=Candidatus Methanoperedens nitratireducens TaxID=1392998 RepID=A0A284VJ66_9EURY|nr:hypothetical protein MNV_110025 [Candidatus Methanoperedens nitroreducens]
MGDQSPRAIWDKEAKITTTETTEIISLSSPTQGLSLLLNSFIFSIKGIVNLINQKKYKRLPHFNARVAKQKSYPSSQI